MVPVIQTNMSTAMQLSQNFNQLKNSNSPANLLSDIKFFTVSTANNPNI